MSDFQWIRFGTATDYITGGDAPADLPTLENVPTTFDGVMLRDISLKAHSVLANHEFWQKYFEALTIEYQNLVHHANFLKYIYDYKTYLGEEREFDKRIQNIYVTLGFPFSVSFGDYINADDPDFKSPDSAKEKDFFNKKIFWKQFSIENIVFLRKWLGALYAYRQIFSSIFRRGSVFLTFKYETNQFSETSDHKFRLFDSTTFGRVLPNEAGTSWPNTTTIDGVVDYSFVSKNPYRFDSDYLFDGTEGEPDTIITWDSGITASNTNKGLALEITCDRILYHYNTLYNPTDLQPVENCLMDLPWVEYILNLSATIKRATDKLNVGSQLTLVTDKSNTITPYVGSGADERLDYTHPNVRAKFQVIASKYNVSSMPTLIRVGNGAYGDWDGTNGFFLRRDQLSGGNPPTDWENKWGVPGPPDNNDIESTIFEMTIGPFERERSGIWDFTHTILSSAKFKNELLSNQTIKVNKFPATFYLTITSPCTVSGNITITLGILVKTIALTSTNHDTTSKVAEEIRKTKFSGWDVKGSDSNIRFFPLVQDTYNDPSTVLGPGTTGVAGTCTGIPAVENTIIQLPHTYIAPGSVKLRFVFSSGISGIPSGVTHEVIIKEIRQNNAWQTVTYVKSNYRTYLNSDSNTILEYYDGYKDITENEGVYYDSSAIDDSGDFLDSYFRTQETTAFNLQEVDPDIYAEIDHGVGTVTIAPQFIRNAFSISQQAGYEYTGTGDRFQPVTTNVYCTYNTRANQTLKDSAVVSITELGLFNGEDPPQMIAYATFPPIIYDSLKHHASFNMFITGTVLDTISI